jgi:hypothetical protein
MPEALAALAPLESLLDEAEGNDAQLWLTLGDLGFSPGKIDRSGPVKRYTATVLFRDKPELYRAIVVLGAEPGMSIRRICKITHCADETVKAVLAREPVAVGAHKKQLLGEGRLVQRASLERLSELSPTMSAKDAALTFGIVTDKIELLSGGVTSRVEVTDGAAVLRRFLDLHEKIEKTVRGEVIEGAVEMGSIGEKSAVNGPALPASVCPITSDNENHIKSDCVDAEALSDDAISPIVPIDAAHPVSATDAEADRRGGMPRSTRAVSLTR